MLAHGPADAPSPTSGRLPLGRQDDLDQFHVTGTMPVRSMIRELINAQVQVALYSDDHEAQPLLARVQSLEADAINLHLPNDQRPPLEHLLSMPPFTLVGITGAVKIQLPLDGLERHRGNDGTQLRAPIPGHGWRV